MTTDKAKKKKQEKRIRAVMTEKGVSRQSAVNMLRAKGELPQERAVVVEYRRRPNYQAYENG